jgi:hypothetical protein
MEGSPFFVSHRVCRYSLRCGDHHSRGWSPRIRHACIRRLLNKRHALSLREHPARPVTGHTVRNKMKLMKVVVHAAVDLPRDMQAGVRGCSTSQNNSVSLITLFRSLRDFADYAFLLITSFRSKRDFAHYAFSLITRFR